MSDDPHRFTVTDNTFVEVSGVVGSYVYIFQGGDNGTEKQQITLTHEGAASLARQLLVRVKPEDFTHDQ